MLNKIIETMNANQGMEMFFACPQTYGTKEYYETIKALREMGYEVVEGWQNIVIKK